MIDDALPGEDALIHALTAQLPPPRHTRLAIGDDAAALSVPPGALVLVTTDLLVEDVHFRLAWNDLPALGWKALAQNLSDIAAMGGTPTHAVIALGLPPTITADAVQAIYAGMVPLAEASGTEIVGGDTNRAAKLTLALTVLGQVREEALLTRAGAHAGEALFVTGTLGLAAAGLRLLECGHPAPAALQPAIQAQLRPQPRLTAGCALGASGLVTAMMDLSDGLATDLHRLCRASRVGAIVDAARLPIDPHVDAACAWLTAQHIPGDPQQLALLGGEDFELLFTAAPGDEEALKRLLAPLSVTRIGAMTSDPALLLQQGTTVTPLPWGFTHF